MGGEWEGGVGEERACTSVTNLSLIYLEGVAPVFTATAMKVLRKGMFPKRLVNLQTLFSFCLVVMVCLLGLVLLICKEELV